MDINFVGVEDVEALPQARESFERALVSCCERAGCAVKRAPTDPDAPRLDPEALAKDLHRRLGPAISRVLKWSKKERAFLDSAEIEPRLLTEDPDRAERIGKQPMLLWKRQHLRKRGRS